MHVVGLIPGPHAPKDINSFLNPLVNELLELQEGKECFNILTNQTFILRAYIINFSGDMPALSKLLCTTGSNGVFPCRHCHIQEVKGSGTVYYYPLKSPLNPTRNFKGREFDYDVDNLPFRTVDSIKNDFKHVAKLSTKVIYHFNYLNRIQSPNLGKRLE
jgi:hypothetical protein